MDIKELAKELSALYWEDDEPHPDGTRLAKHVQKLILEGKIESHSFYLSDNEHDSDGNFAKNSIAELQAQLDQLKDRK